MKTLYLCRHAKSSWADPGTSDHERGLNDRGQRNAPMMARMFVQRGEKVDLLVSSTAKRALATARHFSEALDIADQEVLREPKIYEASTHSLAGIVSALPEDASRVMLFGHNPGFTELIAYLTGEELGNLPTCGLARIDLQVDEWEAAGRDTGSLAWLDYPKRYEK